MKREYYVVELTDVEMEVGAGGPVRTVLLPVLPVDGTKAGRRWIDTKGDTRHDYAVVALTTDVLRVSVVHGRKHMVTADRKLTLEEK